MNFKGLPKKNKLTGFFLKRALEGLFLLVELFFWLDKKKRSCICSVTVALEPSKLSVGVQIPADALTNQLKIIV